MPLIERLFSRLPLAAPVFLWSASALASEVPSTAECTEAYENAQELRNSGKLVAAREGLSVCASDACPAFIRQDCATWSEEVQIEIPTVVFAVRSRGRDLSRVRITANERLLTSHIDGQGVELDPGEYTLRFEADSLPPLEQTFVIARGERNRLISVDLPERQRPVSETPPRRAESPPASAWPLVLMGVGVTGVGGFVGLGLWGRSGEDDLKATCAPLCSADRVSEVRTRYLLADAALGVGVASLALGSYLFFTDRGEARRSTASAVELNVAAGPGTAKLTYGGRF